MPIMFNTILREAGLPLADVRLLRHADKKADPGLTPYELWCNDRPKFEVYQSIQSLRRKSLVKASYWAVFLGTSTVETMFAGIYAATHLGLLEHDTPRPEKRNDVYKAGEWNKYDLVPQEALSDLIGKLFIDWGDGFINWIQYPEGQNKPITELRIVESRSR